MKQYVYILILIMVTFSTAEKIPFEANVSYSESGSFQIGFGKANHYFYLQPEISYSKSNESDLIFTDNSISIQTGYKYSYSVIEFKGIHLNLNTSLGYGYSKSKLNSRQIETRTYFDFATGLETSRNEIQEYSRSSSDHSFFLGFSPEIRYQNFGIFVNPYSIRWSTRKDENDLFPYEETEPSSNTFKLSRFTTVDEFNIKDLQFGFRFFLPI